MIGVHSHSSGSKQSARTGTGTVLTDHNTRSSKIGLVQRFADFLIRMTRILPSVGNGLTVCTESHERDPIRSNGHPSPPTLWLREKRSYILGVHTRYFLY